MKKEDRRVQRTRLALQEAFIDLMIEKGYEAVTVQDIIDRANIGRSTFYAHYEGKEQLLLANMERLHAFLQEQIAQRRTSSPEEGGVRFGFSFAMLQHVQGHKSLYRAIVGKPDGAVVIHRMREMLLRMVEEEIGKRADQLGTAGLPSELAAEFVLTTFFTVLSWWMERGTPCSAEACDRLFHRLAFGGLLARE
ncbi:TetR/AcrR family transcriptional regulator [Paenibacillus sp.]|uniref:TetR/AcrR family transcriptional regulator n=1 Tax=Paenibacillus sp. TaxID=58172 RepID=UPI002D5FE2BD|nr:TetR/AcrR family transcriptional regulator [Paenibacillus sp.]HZG86533.1 TetR/AcrR family transcriptional regulator [Paenibacillus sp.]